MYFSFLLHLLFQTFLILTEFSQFFCKIITKSLSVSRTDMIQKTVRSFVVIGRVILEIQNKNSAEFLKNCTFLIFFTHCDIRSFNCIMIIGTNNTKSLATQFDCHFLFFDSGNIQINLAVGTLKLKKIVKLYDFKIYIYLKIPVNSQVGQKILKSPSKKTP